MTLYLHLKNERIPYIIKPSKARSLSLRYPNTEALLLVEVPKGYSEKVVEDFIRKKSDWILKHYRNRQNLQHQRSTFWANVEKGKILYLGEQYSIVFQEAAHNRVQMKDRQMRINMSKSTRKAPLKSILYPALRALASNYLKKRTHELAQHTHTIIKTVRIKDHSSKWGSCSSLKNINLNWHLIFLPPSLIDYVIIHELMHLREMNHSPAFWQWVERFYPKHKQARKQMKAYQWLIGIFDSH